MSFWNSQALIFIFYGYSTRNSIQNSPWGYVDIHFFTYPHLTIFQKIINISILYRKKLVLFYNCLIIVGNNIHMIHKQKIFYINTVFIVFYNGGQKICSPYTYKHFMHKLWINHMLYPNLSTKFSTIVKNSIKMPFYRVIHNIHIVFHNFVILCGLMFITLFLYFIFI